MKILTTTLLLCSFLLVGPSVAATDHSKPSWSGIHLAEHCGSGHDDAKPKDQDEGDDHHDDDHKDKQETKT